MNAIRSEYGKKGDEYGATLFVSHHLKELEESYWEQRVQKSSPEPADVLDLLIRSPYWNAEEDGIDQIDFTLPDDVTNYVLCVEFDPAGKVEQIVMES
ncbi:MAG: hypothetical protein ACO1QR_00285 [Chthoniobacteraceae bacterium]